MRWTKSSRKSSMRGAKHGNYIFTFQASGHSSSIPSSQAKLEAGGRFSYNPSVDSDSTVTLPAFEDSIPLTARPGEPYPFKQAAYSSESSNIYAPRAQAPERAPIFHNDPYDTRYPQDEEYGHHYGYSSPLGRQSTDEVSW